MHTCFFFVELSVCASRHLIFGCRMLPNPPLHREASIPWWRSGGGRSCHRCSGLCDRCSEQAADVVSGSARSHDSSAAGADFFAVPHGFCWAAGGGGGLPPVADSLPQLLVTVRRACRRYLSPPAAPGGPSYCSTCCALRALISTTTTPAVPPPSAVFSSFFTFRRLWAVASPQNTATQYTQRCVLLLYTTDTLHSCFISPNCIFFSVLACGSGLLEEKQNTDEQHHLMDTCR